MSQEQLSTQGWERVRDAATILRISAEYFRGLSDADLVARSSSGSTTREQLHRDLSDSATQSRDLTDEETAAMNRAIARSTAALRPYSRISGIPWRLAIFESPASGRRQPENGWPHTHGDVIFLPLASVASLRSTSSSGSIDALAETLVHEQLHVFQRVYPVETLILVRQYWDMRAVGLGSSGRSSEKLARSNPDLSRVLWSSSSGVACQQVFRSDKPSGLADSELICRSGDGKSVPVSLDHEHPHEAMAYLIAELTMLDLQQPGGTLDSEDPIDVKTRAWMTRFL
jgi:hypothetical protein